MSLSSTRAWGPFRVSVPVRHVCFCVRGWGVRTVTRRSVRFAVSVRSVFAVGRVFSFLGDSSLPSALAAPASLRPHRPRPLDPGDLLSWWGRGRGVLREHGVGVFAWGLDVGGLGRVLKWGRGWGLG